ncbi:MAG: ribonuclease HII [Pseudomonadales bacterium]|jgi:ribonuclease HII|tara:strand:- start:822 stop:1403 length:582 start_codon:yes stop_codon:yes gene_type:complete
MMGLRIAGLDEVGRGPIAGPVVAAAVILDRVHPIEGLKDSKALSERQRNHLDAGIKQRAVSWALGRAEVDEIDALNILQASLLAMTRAFDGLKALPELALVDGNRLPDLPCIGRWIIKGDQFVGAIQAASIIAKVARDAEMVALDSEYPGYGFAAHKGYPTLKHRAALIELGLTPHHRRTFAPCRTLLAAASL